MGHRTAAQTYERRVSALKRRRDYLDKRIANYQGNNDSFDKSEAKAIDWALNVIENSYGLAVDLIRAE